MQQLGKVLTQTTWANASNTINKNSDKIYGAVTALEHATFKQKGYFISLEALQEAYPTPQVGWQAFIYNPDNQSLGIPQYDLYSAVAVNGNEYAWELTSSGAGDITVDVNGINQAIEDMNMFIEETYPNDQKKLQRKLNYYTENTLNGEAQITPKSMLHMHAGTAGSDPYIDINSTNLIQMGTSTDDAIIRLAERYINIRSSGGAIELSAQPSVGVLPIDLDIPSIPLAHGTVRLNEAGVDISGTSVRIGGHNFNEVIPETISEADKQSMEENGTWDEFAQSHTLIYIYEDDNT